MSRQEWRVCTMCVRVCVCRQKVVAEWARARSAPPPAPPPAMKIPHAGPPPPGSRPAPSKPTARGRSRAVWCVCVHGDRTGLAGAETAVFNANRTQTGRSGLREEPLGRSCVQRGRAGVTTGRPAHLRRLTVCCVCCVWGGVCVWVGVGAGESVIASGKGQGSQALEKNLWAGAVCSAVVRG